MPLIGARGTASRGYFGGGTKPGAPTITSSTQGVSSLSIAFDAPIFNGGLLITKYEHSVSTDNSIWTAWALASSSTSPPTSPVTVSGLTNGQAYYVKIRAVNGLGAGPESNVWNTTTTPRTVPNAPTLNSVTRGYRSLILSFSAPGFNGGSPITDYEFSINNGITWASMGQSGTANYTITGLSDFTNYDVRIRAINVAGPGSQSNMLSGVTAGVTNAPIGLSATSNGVFQSILSWTAPDNNASPISDYIVQYSPSSTFAHSITTFNDGVSATTGATVTSLAASTTYYFRVASVNQVGQSGWSSIASATTAGVPSQVGTPTSSAGDRSFTISWSAPSDGGSTVTGYRFQLSSNGGLTWGSTGTTTLTSKTWEVENDGTSYVGRVQAYNAVGDGPYSAASASKTPAFQSSGTISATENSVSAPSYSDSDGSLLTAGVGTQGQRYFTVSFDPPNVSNFSYAKVCQSSDAVNWNEIKHVTSNGADSVTSTVVNPGAAVYFKMTTWNANSNSVESGRVDKTATGNLFYWTYDTTNQSLDSGISYVDSNTYNNEINSAEFSTNQRILSVRVYASSETGTATICTSSRYFRYAWKAAENYSTGFTTGSGLVPPFSNNSGTTYQNLDIGASTWYGTGMRFKVAGAGSIASGWNPRIRVFYRIVYRNRYGNNW